MTASYVMAAVLTGLAVATLVWLPPLHPAQLWSIPWALACDLYVLRLLPYRTLGVGTAALACGASVGFVVGAAAGARIRVTPFRQSSEKTSVGLHVLRTAAVLCLGLTALFLSAFLAQAAARYGIRAALISTVAVRDAVGAGEFAATIKYVYAALAATALCAIVAAREPAARAGRWRLATLLAIASIYFSTGRGTLVVATIVGLVAYVLARDRRLTRAQFIGGCVGVAVIALIVFVVGGRLIGKTYANNPSIQAVPSAFRDQPKLRVLALPYEYASAPIAALDVQIHASTAWGATHGCAALSEGCRVLHKLGLPLQGTSRIRPFTTDPLPWNTYTALDIPLLDGGYVFAIPILGLCGLVMGWLWRLARRRSLLAICAYAILAPAAATSSGSFSFTAPHLIGAVLIAFSGIAFARPLRRVLRHDPIPMGELR